MRAFFVGWWHDWRRWRNRPWSLLSVIGWGVVGVGLVWFGLAFFVVHRIDDNPNFQPPPTQGPRAVAMLAALIDREVTKNGWTANDPWIMPGWILDNKPSYQVGIMRGISRMTIELRDSISRVRGASQVDANLEQAAGLLQYPPDRWYFDFSASLLPVARAESQYNQAAVRLRAYGAAVAQGEAVYELRADNLRQALERISSDLGAIAAQINDHQPTFWLWDRDSDNLFYHAKGQIYAYARIMAALREDFAEVIEDQNLQSLWHNAQTSFQRGSDLRVWMVIAAPFDSQMIPNHLMAMGFFLLQGRTQLEEIADVLRN